MIPHTHFLILFVTFVTLYILSHRSLQFFLLFSSSFSYIPFIHVSKGKYGWGTAGDESSTGALDPKDPNYEEEEV